MNYKHGGNLRELADKIGLNESDICDFSANINPLGPPDWLRSVISRAVDLVGNYPDPNCKKLVKTIANHYNIAEVEILVANGSAEIISAIPQALGLTRAVIPVPAYNDYEAACELAGMTVEKLNMAASENLTLDLNALADSVKGGELVFIANPNNPTGLSLDANKLRELIKKHNDTVFAIDEAFIDFMVEGQSLISDRLANVIVLRSMTKFYAIAGIRLGFAVGSRELIGQIRKHITPWSVNAFAQAVGIRAIEDKQYAAESIEIVSRNRQMLYRELSKINGLYVYSGQVNFLLVKISNAKINAPVLASRLLEKDSILPNPVENTYQHV